MARIDLHLHTFYSDGSYSPTEVINFAHQVGVTALAITDHDTIAGTSEAIQAGTKLGIEIIPGIELSSRFEETEIHLLGYFLDWQDSSLQQRLIQQRISRHTRNPQIVEKLNKFGLSITYDEVKAKAGSDSVGRPHIAEVLIEKGYVRTSQEAFSRYLGQNAAAYISRNLPDTTEVIGWIREAGGVPVLAHPNWTKRNGVALKQMCVVLKESGLSGIEVFYSTHNRKQTSSYLELAKSLDLLITGGSDFHGTAKPNIQVGIGQGNLKVNENLLEPLRNAKR